MTGYWRFVPVVAAVLLGAANPFAGVAFAKTVRVEITGLAYVPAAVDAQVGDAIEWVNKDFVAHTATARNGEFDVQLAPHVSGKTIVKTAGKAPYYCRYHPNMKGEITIAPP